MDKKSLAIDVVARLMKLTNSKKDGDLANALGVPKSNISNWRSRGSIPLDECLEIATEKKISLDWLILGRGDESMPPTVFADHDFESVVLYDIEASAGHGAIFDTENVMRSLKFNKQWLTEEGLHAKDLICVHIRGDSMTPTLCDRDTVLINRACTQGDGVFVITTPDGLRVKRLQWMTNGDLRISSDNAMYKSEIFSREALEKMQFKIIGHVHTAIGRVQ